MTHPASKLKPDRRDFLKGLGAASAAVAGESGGRMTLLFV